MSDTERTCMTCIYCVRRDYGYSNYTVEGTTADCSRGLNDGMVDGEWYALTPELAKVLDKAKECTAYEFGAPAHIDVDENGRGWDEDWNEGNVSNYADDRAVPHILAWLKENR